MVKRPEPSSVLSRINMRIMPGLGGSQIWLVYVGDHADEMSFTERTDKFDSPENIQIRDQFIKSINFL